MPWVRLILALFLFGAFFLLALRAVRSRGTGDPRLGVLAVFTIIGVLVTCASEALGAISQLALPGVLAFWIVSILAAWLVGRRRPRGLNSALLASPFGNHLRRLDTSVALGFLAIAFCVLAAATLLLIALVAAPNNFDSMTYHLSRVMHWQQQHSLFYFPTPNLRELHAGPWAEMAVLQGQILAGSNRLAAAVQWLAMIGCLIGVSYIAKLLGGSGEAQALAAFIAVTIPMGILQSTSTQTDYVVSLWLVCLAAFSLESMARGLTLDLSFLIGAALGLGLLTKPTILVFAAPVGLWLGAAMIRKLGLAAWKPAIVIISAVLLLNGADFARSYKLFGAPLGPLAEGADDTSFGYLNDKMTIALLLSNLVRNSAIELASSSEARNAAVQREAIGIHEWLAVDPRDPRTTWSGTDFEVSTGQSEDAAGNPLHIALLGLSALLLARFRTSRLVAFGACLLVGFTLFSLVFKWQPWHTRLLLPIFVMASAFVAVILRKTLHPVLLVLVMVALAGASVPALLQNPGRPLTGPNSILVRDRIGQYFLRRPDLGTPYEMATSVIRSGSCTKVGLLMGTNDWEYPLWVMTGAAAGRVELQHVGVPNLSAGLSEGFVPCAILASVPVAGESLEFRGITYRIALEAPPLTVLLAESPVVR